MATPFNTRASSAAVQVVHRGAAGATARHTSVVVQVVSSKVSPYIRLTQVIAQTINRGGTGATAKVASAAVQVIHRGSEGATMRDSFSTVQVVWTTGTPDPSRQRAWTFDFDGHTFYVLDLGIAGALVYDLTTGEWTKFQTEGYDGAWNFKNGFHWRDGKMVVGGSSGLGTLLKLTPDSFVDEGWRPIFTELRGLLSVEGIGHRRQYALRLVGSAGRLTEDEAPVFRMQFSDDLGATWSEEYSIELTSNTRQRIEFRSLGAFTAPGRVFRLYDEGGVKFVGYVEADIGGEDARTPA